MSTTLIENFITYLSHGLIDPEDGKECSPVEYCHKHQTSVKNLSNC